uniref:Uncharacterized protein n=1 Tax=Ananas comosus var. bracteatus TaxID=296719 RepID=A0A6V7QLW8_ANACO|nr:unnamed protein product [Ananas comosus var. bracteatus]
MKRRPASRPPRASRSPPTRTAAPVRLLPYFPPSLALLPVPSDIPSAFSRPIGMALAGSSSLSLLLYLSLAIINTKRCERVRAGERRRARAGAARGSEPGRERAPGAGQSQGAAVVKLLWSELIIWRIMALSFIAESVASAIIEACPAAGGMQENPPEFGEIQKLGNQKPRNYYKHRSSSKLSIQKASRAMFCLLLVTLLAPECDKNMNLLFPETFVFPAFLTLDGLLRQQPVVLICARNSFGVCMVSSSVSTTNQEGFAANLIMLDH